MFMGLTSENVLTVIGNPLINFLDGFRGHWQSFEKTCKGSEGMVNTLRKYQRVQLFKITNISQKAAGGCGAVAREYWITSETFISRGDPFSKPLNNLKFNI
jgi:hypothetical protein